VLGDPARHLPSNPLAVRRVALQHLHIQFFGTPPIALRQVGSPATTTDPIRRKASGWGTAVPVINHSLVPHAPLYVMLSAVEA